MSDDELIESMFESRRWEFLLRTVFNRIEELEKRMTDLEDRVTKDGG